MTNVPDDVREIWTDLYKLFDLNFNMNVSSAEDWTKYWNQGSAIWEKSNRNRFVLALINDTADYIIYCSENRKKAV